MIFLKKYKNQLGFSLRVSKLLKRKGDCHSKFDIGVFAYLVFSFAIGRSMFDVRCSMFDVHLFT